jgi:hypothetical protein
MDADALEFARALISPRASEELGERAADFDWLVGKWSAIVRDYNDDGTVEENEGYGLHRPYTNSMPISSRCLSSSATSR